MNPEDLERAKQTMLGRHLRDRGIGDDRVLAAMARVPRERFVDPDCLGEAYADRALKIACGQTISQPYIIGLMTEALSLSGCERVLEVGTGSGYQAAVLSELAREVITIERIEELSRVAGKRLAEIGCRNVTLVVGDGTLGWPPGAPYDRIIVTAAGGAVPPALLAQLVEGGILVMPVGPMDQQVLQSIRKVSGKAETTFLSGCRFVPLIGDQGWPR